MHHIFRLLFWIPCCDKCKPVFYYCITAVFLTTAYQGLPDKDKMSWMVRCCYLYPRPPAIILHENWLKSLALLCQLPRDFSAQVALVDRLVVSSSDFSWCCGCSATEKIWPLYIFSVRSSVSATVVDSNIWLQLHEPGLKPSLNMWTILFLFPKNINMSLMHKSSHLKVIGLSLPFSTYWSALLNQWS